MSAEIGEFDWKPLKKPANAAELMERELETERLLLRVPDWCDLPAIEAGMNDPRIAQHLGVPPWPYCAHDAEEYVARARKERREGNIYHCAITARGDRSMHLGGCTIMPAWHHRRATLGYWMAHEAWGKGYASEMVGALVRCSFEVLGMNKIDASVYADNPASARVLEKNGFVQEGLRRQQVYRAGRFRDEILWALLRDEWHNG